MEENKCELCGREKEDQRVGFCLLCWSIFELLNKVYDLPELNQEFMEEFVENYHCTFK